jgi:glycyl-tRNA synthetase
MVATQKLDKPIEVEVAKLKFDRKSLGKAFKQDQRVVSAALEAKAESWADFEPIATALETDGKTVVDGFTVEKHMVTWTRSTKKVHEIKYTPSVIEPSFGMGRILYALLEHSFYQRDGDDQRCVMKFPPVVAPIKCAVLPISNSEDLLNPIVHQIAASLMECDLATRVDTSSTTVGRRYARVDEMGVPFTCTVDFQTAQDDTVTLRERDSCLQIRIPKDDVTPLIYDMCHGRTSWEKATQKYPMVQENSEDSSSPETTEAATVVESTSRGSFSRPAKSIL